MARGSTRYALLKRRVQELSSHLLSFLPPPPQSKTSFTPQELDLTRSYILLVHAEIEAFCEDLATEKAGRARHVFDAKGRITPALRRMVAYYIGKQGRCWTEVVRPSAQTVESAANSYLGIVRENSGVKRKNLEKLFYPLGISDASMDTIWLAQMDSFGSSRGRWAHKSIKAVNAPDPRSEMATVSQLLQGLLRVDRMMSRLR